MKKPVKVGKSYNIYFNQENINNCKIYVRAIVDSDQVVVRKWDKGDQRWRYEVTHIMYYEMLNKEGNLFET